jgi:hypothetical protein
MIRIVLCFAIASLAAACSSAPQRSIRYYDVASEAGWPTITGQVVGTIITTTVYIEAVDGLPVRDPETSGEKPVVIAPGVHVIHVSQRMGQYFATVPFQIDAKSGATYRAHAQQDLDSVNWFHRPILGDAGGPTFFWIEDAQTGEPVTPQRRINVSTNGSGSVMPIIVPRGR